MSHYNDLPTHVKIYYISIIIVCIISIIGSILILIFGFKLYKLIKKVNNTLTLGDRMMMTVMWLLSLVLTFLAVDVFLIVLDLN